MDKEKLQQDIDTKKKELDNFTSKNLTEQEKIHKEKIEEELDILEKQLDDLKKLETNTTTDQSQKESQALKETIEPDSDWSYEIIQWSKMYDKLLSILWSEDKVEKFALDIDTVVRKYLDQELDWFSNSIKNSISVGIQFTMMETLIKQWAQWSTQFFEAFSRVKSKSATKAFEWLYKAFGTLWSTNDFYILANKVQNLTWYLSDKKNSIIQSENIPELIDPNQFRILLTNPVWSNQTQIDKIDISTLLTLHSTTPIDIHAWEDELKKIVNNDSISSVITKETISSIQKSLTTADKLLDTRDIFQDKASWLVTTIASFLDIDIPFLGNLGETLGMEFPTDILWEKKDWWVLNFVLGVLGFRGWIKWLHKEYIKEKLDELDIDNEFVASTYTAFWKNVNSTINNDSGTGTWKTCALTAPDSITETTMKAKIPADYMGLKKSIVDNLSYWNYRVILDPIMVAKFAPETLITQNDISIVDITKIGDKDVFVDTYLKYIIPLLADPSDDFITSKNIDQNSFALAIMWGLVGDKYFIEWVNIGLLSPTEFTLSSPVLPSSPTVSPPSIENTNLTSKITKEITNYTTIVDVIIDKIEWWYYHPDMNLSWMGVSWETMMGIDRKHWWNLNTSDVWVEFWKIIDEDRKIHPTLWTHNYRWGNLEPKLRELVWKIIQPHYEKLSETYLSKKSLDIIKTDWRLLFNFIYWAWNWAWRFQKMADVINSKVDLWITNADDLLADVIAFRTQNDNTLIAQWGEKIEWILGLA